MKFCVIGLGVFGRNLARNLSSLGAEVLAIDRKAENVTAVKDDVSVAVVVDSMDPTPLGEFPIDDMDAVIIAIGDNFEASMLATTRVQELGAKKIVCRVLSPVHEHILRLMKVDRLVVPEEVAARGLAQSLLLRDVLDGYDVGDGHAIIETPVPEALIGVKPVTETEKFDQHEVSLVTVKRKRRSLVGRILPEAKAAKPEVLGCPDEDLQLHVDDILVLFGAEKNLRNFLEAHAR